MALARATDPDTSHLAAAAVERCGHASAQRNTCLAHVRKLPGQTAAEIAAVSGMERHAPSRRLPELRDSGLVANGEVRICSVTGNRSLTWVPIQEAR